MKIKLTENVLIKLPNTVVAFGVIKGIKVFGPDDKSNKILTSVYPQVNKKYNLDSLKSHPHSKAYINFSKNIGISPDSAFLPYLQIKRILKGNSVGNINNIVNQYMALELLHNLSYAAYDLDTIKGDVTIEVSKGGETLKPIGDQEIALKPNDFTISDEQGVFYSFSEGYRDSSKITDTTVNVLFQIDAPEGIDKSQIESGMNELTNIFGSSNCLIVNRNTSEVKIL